MTSSPQYESDSSSASQYNLNPFQTHLFDPTRDYLGSKSERREMKRKLNIKEIFNIGQKRPKTQKSPKEHTEKTPIDKKPRIIRRKNLKLKKGNKVKTEVKTEIHGEYFVLLLTFLPVHISVAEDKPVQDLDVIDKVKKPYQSFPIPYTDNLINQLCCASCNRIFNTKFDGNSLDKYTVAWFRRQGALYLYGMYLCQ